MQEWELVLVVVVNFDAESADRKVPSGNIRGVKYPAGKPTLTNKL